ncbi:hypothetical protein OPV22_015925 [Ensete ventricosum]|uniref:Uncharacterized protein n=1 Tax=Ensete ventricosum TaxID=4639 RepID=A0AAV8R6Q1_ENSVE|nr:hypothetical protein OPV22_015925 [Ensete ventricosum]
MSFPSMVNRPKMSSIRAKTGDTAGDDPQAEVEDLLRATEDDVLLKLRVGGHIASRHTSSSLLDHDLTRRFEALKARPPHPPSAAQRRPSAPEPVEKAGASAAADDGKWGRVLGDDLEARFAALKGSSGSGGSDRGLPRSDLLPEGKRSHDDNDDLEEVDDDDDDEDGVSKKEVDKLLKWAIDAARLDPSKSDDDEEDSGDGGSSEDEEDLAVKRKVGEERMKNKGKPKKWFFF